MVHNLYRIWFLVSKITWGIWATSDKQWKVQKVEIQWATFVQKMHSLSKNFIYRGFIYLTFNYLFSKFVMSFLTPQVIFDDATPLYFLAQILHTFDKSSPSKNKFLDLPLFALKFTKFLMSFLKQKVSFQSMVHSSVSWR